MEMFWCQADDHSVGVTCLYPWQWKKEEFKAATLSDKISNYEHIAVTII